MLPRQPSPTVYLIIWAPEKHLIPGARECSLMEIRLCWLWNMHNNLHRTHFREKHLSGLRMLENELSWAGAYTHLNNVYSMLHSCGLKKIFLFQQFCIFHFAWIKSRKTVPIRWYTVNSVTYMKRGVGSKPITIPQAMTIWYAVSPVYSFTPRKYYADDCIALQYGT